MLMLIVAIIAKRTGTDLCQGGSNYNRCGPHGGAPFAINAGVIVAFGAGFPFKYRGGLLLGASLNQTSNI